MDNETEEKVVNGLKETVLFDGSDYDTYKNSLYLGVSADESSVSEDMPKSLLDFVSSNESFLTTKKNDEATGKDEKVMIISSTGVNQYGANLFMWTQQSFNLKDKSFVTIEYSSNQSEYIEVRLIKKSDIDNNGKDINSKIFEKVKINKVPDNPPEKLEVNGYTPIPVITGYSLYNNEDYYLSQQIDMRDLTTAGEYYVVLCFHADFREKKLFRIKVYSEEEETTSSTVENNIKKEIQ